MVRFACSIVAALNAILGALLCLLPLLWKKLVSPFTGNHCRFYPSCSEYSYRALCRHGGIRGVYLTLRRLLRCHPRNPGGIDLVP